MSKNIIEEAKNMIQEKRNQIHEEEKKYPPSDQRLNKFNYVVSIVAVSVLALYFVLCGILEVGAVDVPYFIFTYVVAPIEIVLLVSGINMSILQLVRHRYPRVKLCITLQLLTLIVCVSYVAVVAGVLGWGALVG